jgi:hypothetical protein
LSHSRQVAIKLAIMQHHLRFRYFLSGDVHGDVGDLVSIPGDASTAA